MSRNLGQTTCDFCGGRVDTVELPRLIRQEDCGIYFDEYKGMIVANAACVDCEASYLAWLDGRGRKNNNHRWPHPRWDEGRLVVSDLSHRQSFNDEPGPADYPKYQMVRVRQPWPKCTVCDAPRRAPGGECVQLRDHEQESASKTCNHDIAFNEEEARGLSVTEIRKRWPRLMGVCPLGCGYDGIYYASNAHFVYGDW